MQIKEKIYAHCLQILNEKIVEMQKDLHDLTEGALNDSKSSAGDKYESTSSVIALEKEKIGIQLKEAMEQKKILEKIDISISSTQIIKGSLVKTDKANLFIAIGLGRVTIDEEKFMIISPQSPLGIKLMGLKENDIAQINGLGYFIEEIG